MKNWLTKLKISHALDQRKPLPPAAQQAIARSTDLRQFTENVLAVDRALTKTISVPAPENLHAHIMRAVRSAESVPDTGWKIWPARLVPASALALLLCLTVFGMVRSSRPPASATAPDKSASLAFASATLDAGSAWVRAAPQAALEPLTTEMRGLNHDLENAQNYLLAAVP
jgi:hypothetical protein